VKTQRFRLVFQQCVDRDVPVRTVLLNFSREQEDGLLRQAAIVKIEIHLSHDRTVLDYVGMICELAYREETGWERAARTVGIGSRQKRPHEEGTTGLRNAAPCFR